PMGLADAFQKQIALADEWIKSYPNAEVLYIEHSDIMRDPASAAKQMAEFYGVTLNLEQMIAAVDPNLHRNRIEK
ncbi:MAG: sulfotransferase domain-containing protein, partial [Bacteroidia bacterium]